MLPQAIVFVGFLYLIIFVIRAVYHVIQQRESARRLGCKPVNKFPHTLPWGIDLYRKRIEAVKEGRFNKLYLEHFNKYGATWEENSFGGRIINTMDITNRQTVSAIKFEDYGKNEKRTKSVFPFLGRGLFSLNGPEWKHSRDLVKPLFKRAELSDVDGFKKFVDRMLALIPRDGTTVDLQPLLQKLFLDSSTEFIFGKSINSLLDTSGESQRFLDAFNQALAGAGKRGNLANGNLRFLFMFDKTWEKNYSKVHAFVDQQIARTLAEIDSEDVKEAADEPKHYVLVHEMAKEIRDPVTLRYQLLSIFLPARDGTGTALSNTLFFLARNPSIWQELRKQALALGDTPMTFEVLKGLHFFRYTLFEGIRMQGPSGRLQRVAIRDTVLPRGGGPDGSCPIFVAKGTTVAMNTFPGYRDRELWGEDVENFRPSRFEGKTLGWSFTPFSGGPRICPAQQQVITQGVYLLVRLAKEFEYIENRDECIEYVERIKMLCESRNGVQVALHPPKDS